MRGRPCTGRGLQCPHYQQPHTVLPLPVVNFSGGPVPSGELSAPLASGYYGEDRSMYRERHIKKRPCYLSLLLRTPTTPALLDRNILHLLGCATMPLLPSRSTSAKCIAKNQSHEHWIGLFLFGRTFSVTWRSSSHRANLQTISKQFSGLATFARRWYDTSSAACFLPITTGR